MVRRFDNRRQGPSTRPQPAHSDLSEMIDAVGRVATVVERFGGAPTFGWRG
jgi:hypothetical protein